VERRHECRFQVSRAVTKDMRREALHLSGAAGVWARVAHECVLAASTGKARRECRFSTMPTTLILRSRTGWFPRKSEPATWRKAGLAFGHDRPESPLAGSPPVSGKR